MEVLIILLFWGFIWGLICEAAGSSKNVSGFWLGFFLGFLGLIIVLCSSPRPSKDEMENKKNFDKYDQLEKLNKLKESGAISEDEFEYEKSKILK